MLFFQVNEMKLSLDNELERHHRLENKHQAEVRSLKANFETLKTINGKLKKELDTCLEENRQLEQTNAANVKNLRETHALDGDEMRKKIINFEKVQRAMALELIEESTKLAVVCGTTPTTTVATRHDAFVDCNVMSEAMGVFKEHLEAFRHHVLMLTTQNNNNKRNTTKNSSTGENKENTIPTTTTTNINTSAKLLRHLQNRVQQLRKENGMLRENSVCEGCQGEIKSLLAVSNNSSGSDSKLGSKNFVDVSPVRLTDKQSTPDKVASPLSERVTPEKLVSPVLKPVSSVSSGNEISLPVQPVSPRNSSQNNSFGADEGSYIETISNNDGGLTVTIGPRSEDNTSRTIT